MEKLSAGLSIRISGSFAKGNMFYIASKKARLMSACLYLTSTSTKNLETIVYLLGSPSRSANQIPFYDPVKDKCKRFFLT